MHLDGRLNGSGHRTVFRVEIVYAIDRFPVRLVGFEMTSIRRMKNTSSSFTMVPMVSDQSLSSDESI